MRQKAKVYFLTLLKSRPLQCRAFMTLTRTHALPEKKWSLPLLQKRVSYRKYGNDYQ
jgi:hypothetical protein